MTQDRAMSTFVLSMEPSSSSPGLGPGLNGGKKHRLLLRVHSGESLRHVSSQGTYCKVYVGGPELVRGTRTSFKKMLHADGRNQPELGASTATGGSRIRTLKTSVQKDGRQNPIWNEKFEIPVLDPKQEVLSIRVKSIRLMAPAVIGTCAIALREIQDGSVDRWVKLTHGKKDAGRIRLQLRLISPERHSMPPSSNGRGASGNNSVLNYPGGSANVIHGGRRDNNHSAPAAGTEKREPSMQLHTGSIGGRHKPTGEAVQKPSETHSGSSTESENSSSDSFIAAMADKKPEDEELVTPAHSPKVNSAKPPRSPNPAHDDTSPVQHHEFELSQLHSSRSDPLLASQGPMSMRDLGPTLLSRTTTSSSKSSQVGGWQWVDRYSNSFVADMAYTDDPDSSEEDDEFDSDYEEEGPRIPLNPIITQLLSRLSTNKLIDEEEEEDDELDGVLMEDVEIVPMLDFADHTIMDDVDCTELPLSEPQD